MEIPGYQIQSKVGQGGMAVVYRALQESLQRPVALKVLNPLLSDDARFSERFLREGRILASLNHANIITIHDIGISDGYHFISMEYVDGPDLKTRLKAGIEPGTAVAYCRTIAESLGFAHDKGVVHRDVKPANILFRTDGTLLLSDFGIAKQLDGSSDITLTGTPMGSPNYLSPEQAQGIDVTESTDIYGLGAIFYEMLTGEKAFKGANQVDTIVEQLKGEIPQLPYRFRHLQGLLDGMLARNVGDRLTSMGEVIDKLDEVLGHPSEAGAPREQPMRQIGATAELDHDALTVVNNAAIPSAKAAAKPASYAKPMAALGVASVGALGIFWAIESNSPAPPHVTTTAPVLTEKLPKPKQKPELEQSAGTAGPVGDASAELSPDDSATATTSTTGASEELLDLLRRGELALSEDRLTTPVENNALHYYLSALRLESSNKRARSGMKKIVNRYHALATEALAGDDPELASAYIRNGMRIEFSHPGLVELQRSMIDQGVWQQADE